jgi:hypothetical protein
MTGEGVVMTETFADNYLCSCRGNETCAPCVFCEAHNTGDGRKALCEKITRFLVLMPFYQRILARTMGRWFPDKVVYDDEKDICTMLFEAILFEDASGKMTPMSYFVERAVLADAEERLYEAWRDHTRYGFFVIDKIVPGKEVHLSGLGGSNRYRVYEAKGTARMQQGMVIIARIVPFLKGWMMTTEMVPSWSGRDAREHVQDKYGEGISQFDFTAEYLVEHQRRIAL